ncbi:MAG TPA: S1 RNA-binding domain-containing protein [Anaerolineaceae bacterium]|nr:S1 RNA-binding domain-containing protein [Anaerolineaceae bacterium]
MLTKRPVPNIDDEVRPVDEGWWASVLADEEGMAAPQRASAGKHTSQPAQVVVDWDRVRDLYDHDEIILLQAHGYNRGGLLVAGEGLQGFVPVSHLVEMPNTATEEERKRILVGYVGRSLKLKVIECEPDQERVVFSERAALAGEGRRKMLFRALKPGEAVWGSVTNVTDFGVFVDLGGLEGLIHVSELSWGRVQHPGDVLQVGQEVQALVLQVSEENSRVALSLKRLTPNPWETITQRYSPGDVVNAVITGTARFGAFARLEEGVEGLIHVSSMSAGQNDARQLKPGQKVKVRILHVESEKRRLGLSLINGE